MMIEGRKTMEEGGGGLHSRLRDALDEASYYREIAKETGKRHLREINQFSRAIADLKEAREALKESEGKFRTLFDLSPQAIALIELKTGHIVDVNHKFCEISRYPREEVLGRTATDIGLYTQGENSLFLDRLLPSGEVKGLELDIRAGDGSVRNILLFAKVIYLKKRRFLLGTMVDITEVKRLESQLQHAQKMEALGTLAGGVAHDFNNLLMGIQGNASLLLYDMDERHPHYEPLKNIERQVRSGAKLTSQLLGYARKGRYEVKLLNLNRVVEETSAAFARTRKELNVRRELAEDLPDIQGDRSQLEQVLFNLYVNASDAMPQGGDLILRTRSVTHDQMTGREYDPKPGGYAFLEVTDTGVGIAPEVQGRIFEPFFTTKEMGRGTGLGLASVYGTIKGHGGYIDVNSERGRGTTFSIYLPVAGKGRREPVQTREGRIRGIGTILLVDDEDLVLDVAAKLLRRHGYRVIEAKSGEEAIDIYGRRKEEIDVVILDMVMPDMGGGRVFDRLKEIDPDVKVLLSSGYSKEGQADEILMKGCAGFIQKPFAMNELAKKIMEILRA